MKHVSGRAREFSKLSHRAAPTGPKPVVAHLAEAVEPASQSNRRALLTGFHAPALAESFFATIRRELLGTSCRPSRSLASAAIFDLSEGW